MKKTVRIVSLFVAAALSFTLCACSGPSRFQGAAKDTAKYNVGDASISDTIENIVIDWVSGEIDFSTHDKQTVDIAEVITGSADEGRRMHWRVEGTTLYIRYDDSSFKLISFGNLKKDLTVTLPKGLDLNKLRVDATSAIINGQDLTASDLDIDMTSGALDLGCTADELSIEATSGTIKARCSAKEIDVDVTSGKIDLTQEGDAETIAIKATSGKINASLEKFNDLNIDATSADVLLCLPQDTGFTADIDSTSGEVDCDFPAKIKNGRYTVGDGSAKINIDITSGDVSLKSAE